MDKKEKKQEKEKDLLARETYLKALLLDERFIRYVIEPITAQGLLYYRVLEEPKSTSDEMRNAQGALHALTFVTKHLFVKLSKSREKKDARRNTNGSTINASYTAGSN
jgi:hypothetical protein